MVTGERRRESWLRKGEEREQVHTDHLVSIISSLIIQGRDDGLEQAGRYERRKAPRIATS